MQYLLCLYLNKRVKWLCSYLFVLIDIFLNRHHCRRGFYYFSRNSTGSSSIRHSRRWFRECCLFWHCRNSNRHRHPSSSSGGAARYMTQYGRRLSSLYPRSGRPGSESLGRRFGQANQQNIFLGRAYNMNRSISHNRRVIMAPCLRR